MAGPWEKYAAQQPPQEGPWTKYAAMATPPQPTLKDRLMKMANGAANTAEDSAPVVGTMVGGSLGGLAGAGGAGVGAIPASIAGAGLGGAIGKEYQILSKYLRGARDPIKDDALDNFGAIAKSGLGGIASESAGQGAMAALKAVGPSAAKIMAAVPEKYGKAVFSDPSILNRAHTLENIGNGYNTFENYTGLKGLESTLVSQNRATAPTGELEGMVLGAANKVMQGKEVSQQELYLASQAASRLKLAAKYGEPQAQMASASAAIQQGKSIVDKELEKTLPEYGSLRKGMFEAKARDAFSNIMPQNKDGTANVLRPWAAISEALRGTAAHSPLVPLVSPAVWGGTIRAGSAASPIAKFLARYGGAKAAQTAANPDEQDEN